MKYTSQKNVINIKKKKKKIYYFSNSLTYFFFIPGTLYLKSTVDKKYKLNFHINRSKFFIQFYFQK